MEYKYVAKYENTGTVIAVTESLHAAYEKTLDTFYGRGAKEKDLRVFKTSTGTVFVSVIGAPDDCASILQVPYYNE